MATDMHGFGPNGELSPGAAAALAGLGGGGGGPTALDDLTDVDTTGATTGQVLTFDGSEWSPDAPSAGTVTSTSISDSTATGRAVLTAADAATARGAIGAGTSSFDGTYAALTGKPTLGTAAAEDVGDFAAAAHSHDVDDLTATGTPSASTFLRGDGTWATPTGTSPPDATTSVKGIVRLTNHLGGTADAPTVPGLAGKADASHGHAIGDVTGLQSALDGKQASGSYAAASHTHTASQVSDSTATGRSVLTAADAAAARTAIGAGTSNLALGTTSSTAKAGDYAPPSASTTVQGVVELATNAETTTGTDTARAVTPAGVKAVVDALTIPDSPEDIGAAPATQAINARTTAYTLVASDAGKLVTMTSSTARTLTVPANVFTAGQRVDIADRGTARMTVVAGSGMTVNPPPGGSLVMEGRYAYASLVFISATQADLVGLVAAA